MDPDTLRKNLLALRERLSDHQASIQRDAMLSDSARLTARAPINMAEQASDEQELDLMASRLTASSETLAEITEALDRLDKGQYNVCEECGKEIGERRLEIQPWAKMCVPCKRRFEEEQS